MLTKYSIILILFNSDIKTENLLVQKPRGERQKITKHIVLLMDSGINCANSLGIKQWFGCHFALSILRPIYA